MKKIFENEIERTVLEMFRYIGFKIMFEFDIMIDGKHLMSLIIDKKQRNRDSLLPRLMSGKILV